MIDIDWIGFTIASVAVVLAPGVGSLFIAKTAAAGGARAGRAAMRGLMLGDSCLILLSLFGVAAIFRTHPAVYHIVRLGGAGYLILLGLQSLFARSRVKQAAVHDTVNPMRRALFITLLNPKGIIFFMAFFPAFIRLADGGLVMAYARMTLLFMAISCGYLCTLSHFAAKVGAAFQENGRLKAIARKVCGGLFIAAGIKVAIAVS